MAFPRSPSVVQHVWRLKSGERLGDFILGEEIGRGSMGLVFAAHQLSLNRPVALKFLRDALLAEDCLRLRFRGEAESIARLDHPNIVKIHEIGDFDGLPYLCMELLKGETLQYQLDQGMFRLPARGLSRTEASEKQRRIARLILPLARALDHAHQRNVLHRDIKPGNIVIDPDGHPHLTDFGLAKFLEPAVAMLAPHSSSLPGAPIGTPSYMSPEQAEGGPVTVATDVYGLGAVMFELLTGVPPFRGTSVAETLQWVKELPPRQPRKANPLIDRDLETICLRCLEKNPLRRFASMSALAEDLEAWLDGRPIRSRRLGPLERSVRWMRRNRTGTALIGSLLVMLGLTLGFLVHINRQREEIEISYMTRFTEKSEMLTCMWEIPEVHALRVSSSDLVQFHGKIPREVQNQIRVSIGAEVWGNLIHSIMSHSRRLARVESMLSKRLGRPVAMDFVALKPGSRRWYLRQTNQVDLEIMDPLACLERIERDPQVVVIGRLRNLQTGVLVAGIGSGIEKVQDLKGRNIVFGREEDVLTVRTKALLSDAGLTAAQMRVSILPHESDSDGHPGQISDPRRTHSRELAGRVVRREVDVAPTLAVRFELYRSQGLASIAEFPVEGRFLVARSGLDAEVVEALRVAFCSTEETSEAVGRRESPVFFNWEETLDVLVPVGDAELEALRSAARKAARFDGMPDPFPNRSIASPGVP